MVMDPRIKPYSDSTRIRFNGASIPNSNFINILKSNQQNFLDPIPVFPPPQTITHDADSPEDYDFSDTVLKYINKMLMDEDMEDKTSEFSALQAAEKPFYEILGEQYPPPEPPYPFYNNPDSSGSGEVETVNGYGYYANYNSTSSTSSNSNTVDSWIVDPGEYTSSGVRNFPAFQPTSQSSVSSSSNGNGVGYFVDGLIESPGDTGNNNSGCDLYSESQPVWNFNRGVEEANKFLPNASNLFIDLESNVFLPVDVKKEVNGLMVKEEKKDEMDHVLNWSRGKKNLYRDDIDLEEGRSNKHSAVSAEEPKREEMDQVLLCTEMKHHNAVVSILKEGLQAEASKSVQQNGNGKTSNGGKARGKKKGAKKDVVDLRTLLVHCAQAVAADDRRTANELLKQIRQHSSPYGDGSQRLAYWFADGLEARLVGTGNRIYSTLLTKKVSAADILKAYQLYLAACPFKKVSNFFSNQTIMNLAENATSIHIVDFGIFYGFQWPCLLQKLSSRRGGPPKLRITGIDFPQPGFRPAERVEETGRRLADYAMTFKVPFEYHAIAKKWETIRLEDIKIDPDEMLVVNSMYRFRNLLDETVVLDSPRNAVLRLIRKMNPAIFIQGIVNGSYNAPFFVTRFREALFHYSSVFDIFETNVPREDPERILLERDLFGQEAMNVIACEGSERVERPETYKQWQVRNMRAGFRPLPLNEEIKKKAWDRVKAYYHKDFVIDQDGQWVLQGWKGRIIYAISAWRPVQES